MIEGRHKRRPKESTEMKAMGNLRSIKLALLALALMAILLGSVWFAFFKRESITVVNANPYPCVVAVRYRTTPNNWVTDGWFRLGPGERKTIKATFFRVKPEFFVTGESRDPVLLAWLTEGSDGMIYFVGDDANGQVPKNRDVNLAEVENKNVEFEEARF